ncbi:trypsin-like serine protease [Streptomyces sp. NPDC002990]
MSNPRSRRALTTTALAAAVVTGALTAPSAQAVSGTPGSSGDFAYTARLAVGDYDRSCAGTLVDAEWLLTAASCFADDPAAGTAVPAGAPKLKTTAVIGRADLTGTAGAERRVVELVPRADRNLVLARLNRPVTNVTPVALATSAPVAGEALKFAGYGRTKTEWAPMKLHSGAYTVDSADATTAAVTGTGGTAACAGDAGGPVVRGTGTTPALAAINLQSYGAGCFGTDPAETRTAGVTVRVDDLRDWVNSKVGATPITDFNGDGIEDIAIADPNATVGSNGGAGLVRVVYGGGKGTAEINQDLDWIPGAAEAGDWFGESLATVDYNEDGYTDLVVGTPAEDLGSTAAAGFVDVLYGASGGLGTGATKNTHLEQGQGTGSIAASASEAGDRMGHSLAAGTTAEGKPWILIGVPGEAVGSLAKAGMAFYVHGNTSATLHQDKPNVPGEAEANDAFGDSVTGDANYIAIGAPDEAIGSLAKSGTVAVFSHKLDAEGRPTVITGIDQDNAAVSGSAEAGDEFGSALAMVAFRTSGAMSANESFLAIGSPGEGVSVNEVNKANSGRVVLIRIDAAGNWTYVREYMPGTADDTVSGTSEADDRFGETVTVVNTAPRATGSTATLRLAVGAPGEAIGTATKAGAISTFSLFGAAGDNDRWIEAGDGDGVPGPPGANQYLGRNMHYTGTKLYVGMPYGPGLGAVHALPMSNTNGGTVAAVTTYQPGTNGLPAAGARFGYAAR